MGGKVSPLVHLNTTKWGQGGKKLQKCTFREKSTLFSLKRIFGAKGAENTPQNGRAAENFSILAQISGKSGS